MDAPTAQDVTEKQAADKRGAEDAGRYFRYMAEFVGFTQRDVEAIKRSKPIIEKHIPEIVARFYTHLLRYPPTRKFFLKKDGSIDQDYLELRMRHLTNFWLRTASGEFNDDYARYIDYVGRAHTSHGADKHIYIAERYVIGQVGFIQHAISNVLIQELSRVEADLGFGIEEAWDKLMMVLLEMLSRAYGNEREAETFDPLQPVDAELVECLAGEAFEIEQGNGIAIPTMDWMVGRAEEIADGDRKIVQVDGLSIGVFHHKGSWYAVRNSCLHRGGPVATGCLEGDTLTCPWHGFEYNLTNGQLLVDASARLQMFSVAVENGEIHLKIPLPKTATAPAAPALKENEFQTATIAPGQARLVHIGGQSVAVFNFEGHFYATQSECTHAGGPLEEGKLDGCTVTCPLHGSRFDVTDGQVLRGPARQSLRTYRVVIEGEVGRVEPDE